MTDIPSESTPAEPVPDRASSSGPAAVNLSRGILFNVVIPLALLVAGGAVVALLGTAEPQKRPEPDTSPAGLLRSLPPARVAKLQSLESTGEGLELEVDGVVVPFQEARVAAEVSGRIVFKEKVCEAGGYVRANQLLMKIDSSDYLLDVYRLIQLVKQEKQAIEEANQELDNAKESAGVAERDYALQEAEVGRLESLGQFSSKAEIDQATRALLAAKQQLVSIENQSKLAEQRKVRLIASLDLARAQLFAAISNVFRTEIRAPIEGVIVSEQADLNTFVAQGATLVTIEKTSKVEVASSLRMDQLQWVMDQDQPQETEAELEKADELNKGGEGFANTGIRFPDAAALVSGADQALLDEHVQLFRAVEDELKANLKVAEDKKMVRPRTTSKIPTVQTAQHLNPTHGGMPCPRPRSSSSTLSTDAMIRCIDGTGIC
ncbi:MAG: HlyD family efflux transporter periplasmic adaptor subunit [Rubripirellula sp.]|nr:HlyD family efflux transporter periplasmic adaptor subunit [Rubripirellula sp.]